MPRSSVLSILLCVKLLGSCDAQPLPFRQPEPTVPSGGWGIMLARIIAAVAAISAITSVASRQDVKLPEIDFGRYHALVIGRSRSAQGWVAAASAMSLHSCG